MSTDPRTIERQLCALTGRRHALLVGNGTIGLALVMRALGLAGHRVVLPDSCCLNVPLAVHLAGAQAVPCDVRLSDLGPDPSRIDGPLRGAAALIAVHGYGQPCAIAELQAQAEAAGAWLIEDACLAYGGRVGGRAGDAPIGGHGIASVLSFGAGKPLTLDHGGAVLTDDDSLAAELRRLDAALPAFTPASQARIDALGSAHTRLYNTHYLAAARARAAGQAVPTEALQALAAYRQRALAEATDMAHRHDATPAPALAAALPGLADAVARRHERHAALVHRLAPLLAGPLHLLAPPPGSVPWRLNLLCDGPADDGDDSGRPLRDRLLRALLDAGLAASSWHPPASDFLADAPAGLPVAERIGRQMLNLFIDERCTPAYRDAVAAVLDHELAVAA